MISKMSSLVLTLLIILINLSYFQFLPSCFLSRLSFLAFAFILQSLQYFFFHCFNAQWLADWLAGYPLLSNSWKTLWWMRYSAARRQELLFCSKSKSQINIRGERMLKQMLAPNIFNVSIYFISWKTINHGPGYLQQRTGTNIFVNMNYFIQFWISKSHFYRTVNTFYLSKIILICFIIIWVSNHSDVKYQQTV